jgi:rhodanese-related sulfurtransferase/rubrerythrin
MRWKQFFTPVESLDAIELQEFMNEHKEGSYTLLDVRQPGEYQEERIPGAKLVPLPELNDRLDELPGDEPIVAYCAVGGRSRAAAQLLAGKGFNEVYNLRGGIKAWHGHTAAGPPEMGMTHWTGNETSSQVIRMAYAMEAGLGSLYATLAESSQDAGVKDLFHRLAGIEDRHKQKLADLYATIFPEDPDSLEEDLQTDMMEGGFTTEEFLEHYGSAMQTIPGILDVAMMLEAQAMDLYSRYGQAMADPKGKAILEDIAQEEKGHLKLLGKLREERA